MRHEDARVGQKLTWRRRTRVGIDEWETQRVNVTVVRVNQNIIVVRTADGERHVRAERLEERE